MTPTGKNARTREDWAGMLDQMEAELAEWQEKVSEPAPETAVVPWTAPAPMEDRLGGAEACLDRARQTVDEVDGPLAAEAVEVRRWGDALRQAIDRLAAWAAG